MDFRGYDTFGEIIVLGIAALLIYALADQLLNPGPANDRLRGLFPQKGRAGDRHPLLMVMATRFLLPFALMIGTFLYLRGHNLPGGGFVAGLVFAIAIVMQYMASGLAWTEARQRIDHHALIAAGILTAAAAGVESWLFGAPFLSSSYTYVTLWPLETFELATAAIFDLGVFLCVLGAVLLALNSLSRLARRAGETRSTDPYSIDPPAEGGR